MSKKKNNRTIIEEGIRTFRKNLHIANTALSENDDLEKVIEQAENMEIVGIIRKQKVGLDHLEQVMQGIQPQGNSLFSEQKEGMEEYQSFLTRSENLPRKKAAKKKEPEPEKEGIEHEEV